MKYKLLFSALLGAIFIANASAQDGGLVSSDRLLGRDSSGVGQVEQLQVGGGLGFSGTGSVIISDAELACLRDLTSAANKIPLFTGDGTCGLLDFADEDNMASNSATAVPSQQSVKAYVDNSIAGFSTTFLGLTDTPSSYSGQGSKIVRVNSGATSLEFGPVLGTMAEAATSSYYTKTDIDGFAFLDASDIGATVQGYDADLDAWAAVSPTSYLTTTDAASTYLPLAGGTMTGNIGFSGAQTVDGRDVSADGSKLDGIESGADVTDATNVAAAGAVMDGDFSSDGLMARTGAGAYASRTITGTASEIEVTNGDGDAGNPTIGLPNTISVATAIELGHASENTLTASSGVLSIEGTALLTATSADALFLTPTEGDAAYQPLDSDLTSWAGVTRASGFDTFTGTPSSANLGSLLTDDAFLLSDTDLAALASPGTLTAEGSPAAGDMLVAVVDGAYKTIDWDDLPSGGGGGGADYSLVRQVFTSSGTYTATSGLVSAFARCQSAGGGSAGADGAGDSGWGLGSGGGSGGTYAERSYTAAEIGTGAAITLGSPGSAGSDTGGDGGSAGSSTFNPDGTGSTMTVPGGNGGTGTGSNSSSGVSRAGGAAPSAATNADFSVPGQAGGNSLVVLSIEGDLTAITPGMGGNAVLGFGAQPTQFWSASTFNDGTGNAGQNYGGGASGAGDDDNTGSAGATGGPAICIVDELVAS